MYMYRIIRKVTERDGAFGPIYASKDIRRAKYRFALAKCTRAFKDVRGIRASCEVTVGAADSWNGLRILIVHEICYPRKTDIHSWYIFWSRAHI